MYKIVRRLNTKTSSMIGLKLEVMPSHPLHQTIPQAPESMEEIVEAEDDVQEGRNNGPEDRCVGAVSDGGLAHTVHVILGLIPVSVVQEHELAKVLRDVGECAVAQVSGPAGFDGVTKAARVTPGPGHDVCDKENIIKLR